MKIEDIEHLAGLARLKLTEEEKKKFANEAGLILDFVSKLEELDLDNIEPMNSVTGEENIMRDDEAVTPNANDTEMLKNAFPKIKNDRLSVQQILKNEK